MTSHPIGTTVLGYPRIGRRRELKTALERYWRGAASLDDLETASRQVRLDALRAMAGAGLDTVPVGTFSWYDQMLDTAVLVGAIPERFAGRGPVETYFALARGDDAAAPLEMTKWFDTNYHYLVPEISDGAPFRLDAGKPLAELDEALAFGVKPRPVVVGPFTFLKLAKAASPGFDPLTRLPELTEVYVELLNRLRVAGAEWVQLDEPAAVLDLSAAELHLLGDSYRRLAALSERPQLFVATYFGDPKEALGEFAGAGVDAVGLDLTARVDVTQAVAQLRGTGTGVVLGVVDGRNVWRTDLAAARESIGQWSSELGPVGLSSSCSLQHVPYDVSVETNLPPDLAANLAFAEQKLQEVVALAAEDGPANRSVNPVPGRGLAPVAARLAAVTNSDRDRGSRVERAARQRGRLDLPLLPTTTIGSFPQTSQVRRARADWRAGRLSEADYTQQMQEEIARAIAVQEKVGLDVLVHGEPERNDMVQYFAEHLEGFATTDFGWVQSYGSRCVRPPILFGDIHRPEPITVAWTTYAQILSKRPVKGMLTGPVTILAWSFVRDDQPLAVTADQVALALRDEVADLEAAGTAIVQVDEPALRELLPLRAADQPAYLQWSVDAFRLATGVVAPETQIHTHLCYSEFGEIMDAIAGLDADVTTLEAARSGMEVLADIGESFAGIGPGVYDIHSPRVPGIAQIVGLIEAAVATVGVHRLWVNPDCGLKTRGYREVEPALAHMVRAAHQARASFATG